MRIVYRPDMIAIKSQSSYRNNGCLYIADAVAWFLGWIEGLIVGCVVGCGESCGDMGLSNEMAHGCETGYEEGEYLMAHHNRKYHSR